MLCLKRQFAGLRYGLYITVQLLRVVGDSSVDSELPFCAKGAYRGGPVEYLYPHRSLLAAEISPYPAPCRIMGPSTPPPSDRQMRFLCSSLLVCGRDDLLSRYSRIQISSLAARASLREILPPLRQFFPCLRPTTASLPRVFPSRPTSRVFLFARFLYPPLCRARLIHLPPSQLPRGPNPP